MFQIQSTYEEMKNFLGGKDPEEILLVLLKYVQDIKQKSEESNQDVKRIENWEHLEKENSPYVITEDPMKKLDSKSQEILFESLKNTSKRSDMKYIKDDIIDENQIHLKLDLKKTSK